MLTQSDEALTTHEAAHADAPWVLLRARGYQPGCGSMPGRFLFNVVAGDHGFYVRGSTVTLESMLKLGCRVEVIA